MCGCFCFAFYHCCCCCCWSFKIHAFPSEQYPQHIFLAWHVTVAYLVASILSSFLFCPFALFLIFHSGWTRQLFLGSTLSLVCQYHSADHSKSYWRQTLNRPIKFELIYVTFQTWPIIHPCDNNNKNDSTWLQSDSQFYFYPNIHTFDGLCCRILLVLVTLIRWNLEANGGTFRLEVAALLTGSIK